MAIKRHRTCLALEIAPPSLEIAPGSGTPPPIPQLWKSTPALEIDPRSGNPPALEIGPLWKSAPALIKKHLKEIVKLNLRQSSNDLVKEKKKMMFN